MTSREQTLKQRPQPMHVAGLIEFRYSGIHRDPSRVTDELVIDSSDLASSAYDKCDRRRRAHCETKCEPAAV